VKPTIAREHNVPAVLCCRNHSKKSVGQMLHPPRNPTGIISMPEAGGLSPVTVVPRTIATAQASSYSASFHMARLQGSYYGLDTMYLSTSRELQSNCTNLAWEQDVLSFACRNDIKASVQSNPRAQSCLEQLEAYATDLYPYMKELKHRCVSGATCIPLEQCVKLHTSGLTGVPETVIVHKQFGTITTVETVQCQPTWCRQLIWAQPANSTYGCRPPMLSQFRISTCDTRLLWISCSILLYVGEIWAMVTSVTPKDNEQWEGWLLTYLTKSSLPHIKVPLKGPFRKKIGPKDLCNKYFGNNNDPHMFDISMLRQLLERTRLSCNDQLVFSENAFEPHEHSPITKVVVVYRDYNSAGNTVQSLSWVPPEEQSKYSIVRMCKSKIVCYDMDMVLSM
jgi:hypothetical protein